MRVDYSCRRDREVRRRFRAYHVHGMRGERLSSHDLSRGTSEGTR
jgi:hypothetical protein